MPGDAPGSDFLDTRACCSAEDAILLIGGKWKLLILRILLADGPQRFNQLQRALSPISHKVLSENLKELRADGLIDRQQASPQKVIYATTTAGQGLQPILHTLGQWFEGLTSAPG